VVAAHSCVSRCLAAYTQCDRSGMPWDYTPATLVVFQASTGKRLWSYAASGWIYHVALV